MQEKTSGGPRTDEGKAISKLNAVTHGLLTKAAVLEGEDSAALEALRSALHQELDPQGELESFLVERIVVDMWRFRRAVQTETNAMEANRMRAKTNVTFLFDRSKEEIALNAETYMVTNDDMERIMRYMIAIERSMFRSLHEIQRLKAERNGVPIIPPAIVDVTMDRSEYR
ncbi:MAG: hypothetical protein HY459_03530 [Parcubacteria group bacterium]|nr:hypothetical protein [Parcubacteria group bacterium]